MGIYYNPALIPTHHSSRRMSSSVCPAAAIACISTPQTRKEIFEMNVMKCLLLSQPHAHLFIGQILFSMSTQHLIYAVFHQCFFSWNSVAGEVLKNMQGRLKYGQNPSEQMKQCYLLLVPSVLKTWLVWSDSHCIFYI